MRWLFPHGLHREIYGLTRWTAEHRGSCAAANGKRSYGPEGPAFTFRKPLATICLIVLWTTSSAQLVKSNVLRCTVGLSKGACMEKTSAREQTCLEGYLSLGAALHAIVHRTPPTAYPIRNWGDLLKAASSTGDVELFVRGGKTSLLKELEPNLLAIRSIVGDQYFPITDQQDYARKASVVLMTLVLRFVGSPWCRPECGWNSVWRVLR
jgi:hypothetical protein